MAVPEGLIGELTSKGWSTTPKKQLAPHLAAAAKRRLKSKHVGDPKANITGEAVAYEPGTIK